MGICDDWAYIRSAQLLAQTGHIHYVGWDLAMQGWQLYLGASFIKLFGFSFTAARMPTLLIGLGTAYLMQRTLVRFGINERNAALGTLTFVLSPLFMPLSATMMSDVPGFFSIITCIYGCARALQSTRDRNAILWLCLAIGCNAIFGTSRQIAWLGVLILVPSTLLLLRSRRAVLLYGLTATALGYGFVFAILHWFSKQPYIMREPGYLHPFHIWAWKLAGRQYVHSMVEIGLLLFPVAIPFIAAVRRFSRRDFAGLAMLTAFSAAFIYYLGQKAALLSMLYPFNHDWVGRHALFEDSALVSQPPAILTPLLLTILSVVAMLGVLCIGTTILVTRPSAIQPRPTLSLSWPQLAILFGPFTFVYLLLASRPVVYLILDRYLLAPIFVALVCLLLYSQQHLNFRSPTLTVSAVAAVAFYGILCTHNTFAFARARVVLANEVISTGLPPSHIDLGWEMNGWYELQLSDHLNDAFIVPANAYQPIPDPHRSGCQEQPPQFGLFLHMAPRYGVAYEPNACDGPAPFAPVSYATWPLLHPTTLYVVKYPPPWQSASDLASQAPPTTIR